MDTTINGNAIPRQDRVQKIPERLTAVSQNYRDTVVRVRGEMQREQEEQGGISGVKAQVADKVAEAKDLVKDQVKNKVKQVIKKQVLTFALGLLANPITWVVLLIIVLVFGGLLMVRKLQDETGISFTNICQTVGEQNCLKTVLNQSGVGLKNSNL